MPARSEAQRRWAFGVKGKAWAKRHHYDNKGKLPPRVPAKQTPQDERARLAEAFRKQGKKRRKRG